MRLTAAVCAAAVALLVVPTAADAAKWRGKTRQGRLAVVVTGSDGLVNKVRIRYRARCGDDKQLTSGVIFLRRSGRWTGNVRISVRITRNGRFVTNCRSGRIGWRARPV